MLIQSSGRMVNSVDVEHHTSLEFSPHWVLFVAMLSITLIYSIRHYLVDRHLYSCHSNTAFLCTISQNLSFVYHP